MTELVRPVQLTSSSLTLITIDNYNLPIEAGNNDNENVYMTVRNVTKMISALAWMLILYIN